MCIRDSSQLARRIVLAFPVEIPKEQYLSMIKEFCQEQFAVSYTHLNRNIGKHVQIIGRCRSRHFVHSKRCACANRHGADRDGQPVSYTHLLSHAKVRNGDLLYDRSEQIR